jgi:hypothetical protein
MQYAESQRWHADMSDLTLVQEVASQYMSVFGPGAEQDLRAKAENARDRGDTLSERAWLDIATAVEMLRGVAKA